MSARAPQAATAVTPQRRTMIAKVKIAQKELQLDDGAYRAMLERLTGKNSAADCSEAQLGRVLDELKAKGWKPKLVAHNRKASAGTASRPADHPSAKKARAMWISLHQLGVVRNGSEEALESFAKRQLHVERLQWADQSQVFRLIEALKAMAERSGWSQDLSTIPPELQIFTLKFRLLLTMAKRLEFLGAAEGALQLFAAVLPAPPSDFDALIARGAAMIAQNGPPRA